MSYFCFSAVLVKSLAVDDVNAHHDYVCCCCSAASYCQLHRPLQGVKLGLHLESLSSFLNFSSQPYFSTLSDLTRCYLTECRYEDASSHLCAAAAAGDMRQLTRLIDNGVDPDVRDYDQRTAFHIAARRGCLKVVDYLVQCKAQINAVDRYCFTIRHVMRLAISLQSGCFETNVLLGCAL